MWTSVLPCRAPCGLPFQSPLTKILTGFAFNQATHRKSIMWPTTRDPVFRDSQLKIGWTEEKCIEMDELAQKSFTYRPSSEECEEYQKNLKISLNKSGKNAPMRLRSDFREALTNMHLLHRESGEERPEPIPFHQYQRWHSSSSSSSSSSW